MATYNNKNNEDLLYMAVRVQCQADWLGDAMHRIGGARFRVCRKGMEGQPWISDWHFAPFSLGLLLAAMD